MNIYIRRRWLFISIIVLIAGGYLLANSVRRNHALAWIFVAAFYGVWILISLIFLLKKSDLKMLLQPGKHNGWYIIPALLAVPLFIFVYIPNNDVLHFDFLFALNIFICLVNPWLEELYWRGLAYQLFREKPAISFALSSVAFGLSHPLVFGINSPGIAGVRGFIGPFIIGATWWLCLRKTASLKGCIITHFLIDFAGMAAYILADKLSLLKLPFQ
jgi:membrane protease YdiL (CAAX protease family)